MSDVEKLAPDGEVDWHRPTAALRWYDRTHKAHFVETGEAIRVKTLQQYWEHCSGIGGEWREIKLEIGE